MELEHQYEVNLQWIEDRKGVISSPVLPQKIDVATPPDFPKGMAGFWSPEHLIIASVSSCFMSTFLAVAENSKLEFISFSCDATGVVDKLDGKLQVTEITLKPTVCIADASQTELVKRVLEKSEKNCLISNSLKTNILLQPEIITQ